MTHELRPSAQAGAGGAGWGLGLQQAGPALMASVYPSSASAALLVSLYIKDMWLGAQRPDTLLAHVRMVCEAAEDSPDREEEAIVSMCRDLTAVASDT